MDLKESILELIRKAATDLSPDVEKVVADAYDKEDEGSPAKNVFGTIRENIRMAREGSTPICQDTGALVFYIDSNSCLRNIREPNYWFFKNYLNVF